MTHLRAWILLIVVTLFAGVLSASNGEKEHIDTILKESPGYRLLTLEERNPEVKAYWDAHFPKENPSLIHADFNGDGNFDYALLLKNTKSEAVKLSVFLREAGGKYRNVYELDETAHAGAAYLRPVQPYSKITQTGVVHGSSPPVKLHSTGIQITYFEKARVVLYWNRNRRRIEEIQTGD